MCELGVKAPCAFFLAVVSVCLTAAAISPNTTWYQDTEAATSSNLESASVSWSGSLYQWCLTGGFFQTQTIPYTGFTPTCWSLTVSNPAVNPNNDPTIGLLTNGTSGLIPEFSSGLQALAQGSRANKAALAVSIALGIVYILVSALIWASPKDYPYSAISVCYKMVGFVWHLASWLGFVIWAGGLGKASEDMMSTLGSNTQQTAWILVTNSASTVGFSLSVGASAFALFSCCFGCFIWSSEVTAASKGENPYVQTGGLPVLPAGAYYIPGRVGAPAQVVQAGPGSAAMYAPAVGANPGPMVAQAAFFPHHQQAQAAPATVAVPAPAAVVASTPTSEPSVSKSPFV